jgi:hypothetical protein
MFVEARIGIVVNSTLVIRSTLVVRSTRVVRSTLHLISWNAHVPSLSGVQVMAAS